MVELAYKWGKEPSYVWARAKRKPKDYRLLFAYMSVVAEEQEKATTDSPPARRRRRR